MDSLERLRPASRPLIPLVMLAAALAILAGASGLTGDPLLALGLALLLLLGMLVLVRPWLGLYLFVALIPFEAGLLVEDHISFARLAGQVVFISWAANVILIRRTPLSRLFRGRLPYWMLAYALLAFVSITWADYKGEVLRRLISYVQLIGMVVVFLDLVDSWKALKHVFYAWFPAAAFSTLLGVLQFRDNPLVRAGADTIGSENEYGIMIVTAIPLALYFLSHRDEPTLLRILALIWLPLGFFGIAISGSRTAYLALIPVLLLFLGSLRWRRRIGLLALAGVALLIIYQYIPWDLVLLRITRATNAQMFDGWGSRIYIWRTAWAQFMDHPLLGVGYYNFGYHFLYDYQFSIPGAPHVWGSPRSPHSWYFGVLANFGVLGLFWLMAFFASQLRMLRTTLMRLRCKAPADRQQWAVTLIAALFAYLVFSGSANTDYSKMLWLLFAVSQTMYLLAQEGTDTPKGSPSLKGA